MKESKAVYVTKRDIRENLNRDYQWYTNNNIVNTIEVNKYKLTNDVGIQYNSKRDNIFYTHRNVSNVRRYHDHDLRYFSPIPKQIFTTYSRSKSFTDIGVGSVKALQKKKVKKIYLPETDDRGVGSSDLTDFIIRMQSIQNKNKAAKQYKVVRSYYESKRTSSKCVGGAVEYRPECLVSAKVSPIVHTQSGSTSPKDPGFSEAPKIKESKDIEIGTVVVEKQFVTTDTQFEEPEEEVELLEVTNNEEANEEIKEIIIEPNVEVEVIDENMTKTPKYSTEAVASVEIAPPEAKPSEPKLEVVLPEKKFEKPEPLKGSFSSDSLVQHVHNLEQPSEYSKQRDPMENKMEREYRKMFASISRDEKTEGAPEKQQIPQKSTSLFRRRFTAIRKSLGKKDSKNPEKQASVPSVRDASITSDPPSLEERSFSSINGYPSNKKKPQRKASYKRSYTSQKKSKTWSKANPIDSDYNQGVKGMFKLWGKKFNLEDTSDAKEDLTQPSSFEEKQKMEDVPKEKGEEPKTTPTPAPQLVNQEKIYDKGKDKKEGKKFLFFKKKQSKDKTKNQNTTYKNKKGVTTGRCEVKDGLSLRMGAARAPSPANSKTQPPPLVKKEKSAPIEHYEDLVRTAWLMKYLSNPIESRNSVKIRWNNKTYTTSSSTVFELMGNVYKNTGVILKSKSEITSDISSTWSYNPPNVNFNQNIEAWMIPTTLLDHRPPFMPRNKSEYIVSRKISKSDSESKNIEVTILDQKWIIDKSEAFAHKIEVVLHSKNFVKLHNPETSAECIRINIPKGYFSETSSDDPQQDHTSDEEVYNIVEYESGNCGPSAKSAGKKSRSRVLNSGDHSDPQNIHVSISVKSGVNEEAKIMETVIKRPPVHRDVVVQGSNVYIPKMCDVIGVGIITQRDVREVGKSIIRVMEYLSEEESDHSDSKPCPSNKAKSYLEEYYRHWQPPGMDMFSLCYSDSHMQCCSGHNSRGSYNNGDASKSCPNIFEDYVALMSSCCSVNGCHESGRSCNDDKKNNKKQKKYKKKEKDKPSVRVLPKDSLEVFKKRKIYAEEKSRWIDDTSIGPYSCPSNTDTGVQGQDATSCKGRKVCLPDIPDKPARRECLKTCINKPAGIIKYTAGEKKSAKISPNVACTIPDSESCCRSEPCDPCSRYPSHSNSPPPRAFPPPCPNPPSSAPQRRCSSPPSRPAYGDCPSEKPVPCIKHGSPIRNAIQPPSPLNTCLPCPKSPPCPEYPPCPPSPPKSPHSPKLQLPTKSPHCSKPPSPNKSPPCSKPSSPAKSPPRPEGKVQGDCSGPPSPPKSTCSRNPQTISKPPTPNDSPPNPKSPSKWSPRQGSCGSKSSKASSQNCQRMPCLPADAPALLICPPCPPSPHTPEKVRHRLPKPSNSPSSKSPSCVCTDAGSVKSSLRQQKSSPSRCSPKNCSPKRDSPQRQPSCEACSLSNEKGYECVSSCSVYDEPVRSIFQTKLLLQKTSLAHSLSVLNCEASVHKSVQCRAPHKCGGFTSPLSPSENSCPVSPCAAKTHPCPPCRPRCPTGIKLSNAVTIKLPKPIRYNPPPCPPAPCPPPPCPPKNPPCPPPPCPPTPCPPKTPPSPPSSCEPPPCPPDPCPPPPCEPPSCKPSPFKPPLCKPSPCEPPPREPPPCESPPYVPPSCEPPPSPPKTQARPQKTHPCPPKTPPCPPSPCEPPPCPPDPCPPPPCKPSPCQPPPREPPPCEPPPCEPPPCEPPPCEPPPSPPKTQARPQKTRPFPPKDTPSPPRNPRSPPKTRLCPVKTPPCPPPQKTRPFPHKTPPCPPKIPPCPPPLCPILPFGTQPSPLRSPECSPKPMSCSVFRPPASPPSQSPAPSSSPKASPCPSPPRCPHGIKISNTDCIKLSKPRTYVSPSPSCKCHTPPSSPPRNKPSPPKRSPPKRSPPKRSPPKLCPPKPLPPKTPCKSKGKPSRKKLSDCEKYKCAAAPKPKPADCCKVSPCCSSSRSSRSRSSPYLMHVSSPPSLLQYEQKISEVKCSCHTPRLSDQIITGDAKSSESLHKSHKSSCTPSTFLANVSTQYEEQGDYYDENEAGEDQGDCCDEKDSDGYQDEKDADGCEDQGDYSAEEYSNVVYQRQSEPNQYPNKYDYMDTELADTHPRSQPNMKQIYIRKMEGVNLKKFPRKVSNYTIPNLIRLNSAENIVFKYDRDSESVHEMKDGYAKTQDDANVTLIESKDYGNTKQACMTQIYNDQKNQRATAPVTINEVASVVRDKKIRESKSTESVVNMIEINFKLRVIQGDKTTEINIANEEDEKSNTTNQHLCDDTKEVYILKDEIANEEINPKNDLNIRIIIKNYKPKEPSKEKKTVEDFSQKISKKFNTVSTGYSVDFRGEHTDETCFSIHRATIDLTTSERSAASKHRLMKKSDVIFKDSNKSVKSEEILSQALEDKNEVLSSVRLISATDHLTSVTETKSISEVGAANSNALLMLSKQTKSMSFGRCKAKSNQSLSVHSAITESKKTSKKRIEHLSSRSLRLRSSRSIPRKWSKNDEDNTVSDNKYHNPELVTFKESKSPVIVTDIFKSQARLSFTDTDEHDVSLGNKTSEEPTSKSLNVRTSEDHTDPTDFAKSSDPDSDTKASEVLIEKGASEEIQYIDRGKSKKEEKKEMLKAVFDSANYFKKPKTKNRIQKLKDMLKVLLTSDDTDSDTDHGYQKLAMNSLKCAWNPKVKHNSDSLNNFFECGSLVVSQSQTKLREENYSSNKSAYSEDEEKPKNKTCLCSDIAEKLKIGNIIGGGCCCRRQLPETVSEQISCNFINELTLEDYSYFAPSVECVHCQTNNSRYKSSMHCAKIISINSRRSSFIPHSQKTSSLTPHSQEEAYTLYNLDIEPYSSKLSNKSYKWEKEHKDSSSRDGPLLQEDTDNPETEPVSDRISIKSYEIDRKLKEESSRENYFSEKADNGHNELIGENSYRETCFLEEASEDHQQIISAKVSLKENKREKVFDKKSSYENHLQEMENRRYSSTISLKLSEEDKESLRNKATKREKPDANRKNKKHHTKVRNQADVLQMYETKKAVLEIYAEKTVTDGGEHLVAKLPKYVRDAESQLYQSFEQLERNSYKSVYKRNFVMMCIGR